MIDDDLRSSKDDGYEVQWYDPVTELWGIVTRRQRTLLVARRLANNFFKAKKGKVSVKVVRKTTKYYIKSVED